MADLQSINSTGATAARYPAEYLAWSNMRRRCYSPTFTSYPWYGARGVTVCDRWRESFPAFLADVGPRPSPRHSLDRIDTAGPYEPGNCRWATKDVQQQNRRYCRLTPEMVAEVWRLHRAGRSNGEIARILDCDTTNVWGVVTGKSWRRYAPEKPADPRVSGASSQSAGFPSAG